MKKLFLLLFLLLSLGLGFTVHAQVIVTAVGGGATLGDGGPAIDAQLNEPYGVALDDSGNLYICDVVNRRIRKVRNPTDVGVGIITTIAGNGTPGYSGDNGLGIYAQIYGASDVAIDHHGNVYIADAGPGCSVIRKITPSDTITTIAGTGVAGYNGDSIPASTAQLNDPYGVAVDSIGNIYISDGQNYRIRKIDTAGIIHTIAGTGIAGFSPDGTRADTAKITPGSIRMDKNGSLYFADYARIRKIDTAGIITTIAGNGIIGYSGDSGLATLAEIDPNALVIDTLGNIYIADGDYNRIRKVNTSGIITTVAGNGTSGFYGDNGNPLLAELCSPQGVVVSNSGDIYIGDVCNNRIRLVTMHPVDVADTTGNKFGMSVYPNPTNDEVNIETNSKANDVITITDVLGRLIYNYSFKDKIRIPVDWQAGVYYVQVMCENGYKEVQKLIVQ